jgi:hypothetical protein
MVGHPFPVIPCTICAKAVDLNVDLFADESGKVVHEECYVNHIARRKPAAVWHSLRLQWQNSRFVEDVRD